MWAIQPTVAHSSAGRSGKKKEGRRGVSRLVGRTAVNDFNRVAPLCISG